MSFQHLKSKISEIRDISPDFAEWNTANFPDEKLGSGVFTATEACVLLEHFVEAVELALEDEQLCIERVSADEMVGAGDALADAVHRLRENQTKFVSRVEGLIVTVRPLAMLSMEEMDKKRYRKIRGLDSTLNDIRKIKGKVQRDARKLEDAENKISVLDDTISENQKKSEECNNMHAQMSDLLEKIRGMADDASTRKGEIDQFLSLTQNGQKSLASLEAESEEYKAKLAEFSADYASSMEKAQKLIDSAEKALQLKTAQGLGAAFMAKEEKSGDRQVKRAWLGLGLVAVAVAIGLGVWLLRSGDVSVAIVLARSLVMFVVIGVAVFAGNQFAKNKAIEEDYAYKATLVNSYPGFASEVGDDDSRKEYTSKLLAEILQDPQRVRKAEKKNPFSRKKESSED